MKLSKLKSILKNPKIHILFLFILSSIIIFWKLGQGSLADWDELLYTSNAKSFITPTNYPTVIFKPSLFYWLIAFSYKIFGMSTFSSRLPTALFGVGTILITYILGKELYNKKTGIISSLILLTSSLFIHFSRLTMKDIPTLFLILCSLLFFSRWVNNKPNYNIYLGFFFVLLAFGIKHILGLFPLIVLFTYILIFERNKIKKTKKHILISISIIISIISIWYFIKIRPDYPNIIRYLINHFKNPAEGHNYGWLYYIRVIKAGFFIWFWTLPFTLEYHFTTLFKNENKKFSISNKLLITYITTFIIIIYSYQTKLPWYIIHLIPIFSILTANYIGILSQLIKSKKFKILFWSIIILIISLGIKFPPILDCNPEIIRILDNIDNEKLFIHNQIKDPYSRYYLNEYPKVSSIEAITILTSEKEAYILTSSQNFNQMKELIKDIPKDIETISIGNKGIYLITNSKNYPNITIPPSEETIYYCYKYFPVWLEK